MTATKLLGVDDVKISLQKFAWQDYLMFLVMLMICSMVGIYFGFIKKKPKKSDDATDYLVGGRTMKVFPIAMSLIATFISGISLLGTPTEIYVYGIQYMYVIGGVITMGFIMMYVYLPVFHDLKLTSTYEVTYATQEYLSSLWVQEKGFRALTDKVSRRPKKLKRMIKAPALS